jgi:hypothetical protein
VPASQDNELLRMCCAHVYVVEVRRGGVRTARRLFEPWAGIAEGRGRGREKRWFCWRMVWLVSVGAGGELICACTTSSRFGTVSQTSWHAALGDFVRYAIAVKDEMQWDVAVCETGVPEQDA